MDAVLPLALAKSLEAPPAAAHDAGRHGERELLAQRIADGEYPLADPDVLRRAEGDWGQIRRVHLDDGDVRAGVAPDDLRIERAPVEEANGDP